MGERTGKRKVGCNKDTLRSEGKKEKKKNQ